jgi:hypothetical protein
MRAALLAGAVAAFLAAAPVLAQQPTPPRQPTPAVLDTPQAGPQAPDTAARDTVVRKRVGAGTAFYRSLLIPGWGQISAGAYKRAAVFITLQGASDFMLIKTLKKLSAAQAREDTLRPRAFQTYIDTLRARGDTLSADRYVQNPRLLSPVLDTLAEAGHGLVVSRKKQREDWITLTVFWALVSGMDAFINAQLQDFPVNVNAEPRPGGGALIRASVPLRRFW